MGAEYMGTSKTTLEKSVDLTIVRKKIDAEGREVLEKETVVYNRSPGVEKKEKKKTGVSFLQLKQSLKEKMLEKRKAERKKRCEMLKMENEEGFGEENEEELLEEEEEEEGGSGIRPLCR